MSTVRSPAVAGRFYPSDPDVLATDVRTYVAAATDAADHAGPPPKAIIAPHAGYAYSGPVAGTVYARLVGTSYITRVVLLGPAHTVPLRNMAVTAANFWDTPLGRVPIDTATRDQLIEAHPSLTVDERPHEREHGLEVHLPFLQLALDEFALLPIVVGETPADVVADLLDAVWGGDETLIVVSTDLSHYLGHDEATRRDEATCARIADRDPAALAQGDACGIFPLRGLLVAARRHHLDLHLLDRRTSADTAGDPDRVVGYAAFRADPVRVDDLTPLLDIAADAIAAGLCGEAPPPLPALPAELSRPGAAFVSLHRDGRLLGCIGSLEPRLPLGAEVADKAVAAAFRDPRLPPITVEDFEHMEIEVSVLTPSTPLDAESYDDLVRRVGPGDGITVQAGRHRATLLPVMWKQIPDAEDFLAALWHKAGLRARDWPRNIGVETYRSVEVTDPGPRTFEN